MQRQEQKTKPRQRRSVGELVMATLAVLWGVTTAIFFYQLMHEPTLIGAIGYALWIFQGMLCGLGGLLSLLRLRAAARIALSLAALCLIGLIGVALWIASTQPPTVTLNLIISGALLILALVYFFLGRWLGQQEDSDA
ncbi:hypothetical protein [Armatimonas sp.]|uniref:hypothetical protein n=1 Tax=Armatimonas sp. TaxID=1872638 RepID=UPI00374D6B4C